jgi:hypothetical protein
MENVSSFLMLELKKLKVEYISRFNIGNYTDDYCMCLCIEARRSLLQRQRKFPNGPWCQAGDWVIFGRYAGARFKIEGGEVRILNDDEIIARVDDPNDILQTY